MGDDSQRRSWLQRLRDPLGTGLGRKLLGWFLLFSLVPLLGSNMLGYLESRGIIERLVQRQLSAIAEVEAQHVRNQVDRMLNALEVIASTNDFSTAATSALVPVGAEVAGQSSARGPILEQLRQMLEEPWQFETVYLQRTTGSLVASAGATDGLEAALTADFGEVGRVAVLNARTRAVPPRFRLSVPVGGADGRTVGYLGALMDFRRFGGLLEIPEHVAGSIESFVLDESGRPLFVSHPHGLVNSDSPLILPARTFESGAFLRYPDRDGVDVFGTAVPIERLGWVYVAQSPVSDAFGPLRFLRRVSLVFGTGLAIILAFTAWFVAGQIVAPVRHLVGAARRIGRGDLEARVETRARDEVGELAKAFNEMASDLGRARARVDELHKREIERAQQLATVGELASGVAHEIKNPVVGISGGLDLVRRRIGDDRALTPIVEEMSQQLRRIEMAIRDLLSFARPPSPSLAPADGNRIVERAVRLVEPAAEKSGVIVSFEPDPSLPELRVDAELIRQALVNLLVNAVQATPAGGRVTVSTGSSAGQVRIEVADTGRGIDPETMDEIFKPFFTTRQSGTGLGLSISREIVEQHAGRIEVESRIGEGSAFTLWIPVQGAVEGMRRTPGAGGVANTPRSYEVGSP